jgi:type IV secretory pathway VirB2 component (pilin)
VIDWQLVCLAVMAVAMTVMTVIQVGVLLALAKSARQVAETAREIRQEIRPLAEKVHRIADDAARVASLALTQAERVDQAMAATSQRLDQTLNVVQGALVGPVRQGAAVITAVRAALSLLRRPRDQASGRDEEEALFVG